jgi:hypothetical protein
MKQIITVAFAICLAVPAAAQDDGMDQGMSLMEQGARLFFEGLMSEMEPTLDEFKSMAEEMGPALESLRAEMGPALADLFDKVDDFRNYQAPEILENGDIIIRRKPDAPLFVPRTDGGEIDL